MLIAALIGGQSVMAAESVGMVTILDGDAVLIRGLSKYALTEGTRVLANDLVETGRSTFLRVECADGAIVDLGPATRVQLNRPSSRQAGRAGLYLLAGWLKLSAGKLPAGTRGSIAAREFDTIEVGGEAVERAQSGAGAVFAENGALHVIDRRRGAATPVALASGDFLELRGRDAARVDREPPRDFVAALPRAFADRLPSRIALFRDREVAAKPTGTFTFAEVEAWIDAEPAIRRRFVREWVAKADDAAFHERLEAGLSRHPEWERILHPERFEQPPVDSTTPSPGGAPPH